jgi:hypothetical protein
MAGLVGVRVTETRMPKDVGSVNDQVRDALTEIAVAYEEERRRFINGYDAPKDRRG